MTNRENLAIVLLTVSAMILGAVLIMSIGSRPAYADASVRGGDYIMVAGAKTDAQDLLYVIDVATRRMNVYELNLRKNALDLVDAVDLERTFKQ